jgi:protease I
MEKKLSGKKIAILVENGFEQVELTEPKRALEAVGAETHTISLREGQVKAWDEKDWGDEFPVDVALDSARADQYDGLLLPGGVMNPDKLRRNSKAQEFVRSFFEAGKPVASICHGPWTLIDAGVIEGRTVTSYETLQMDLNNAGANWVDREVVVDNGLVTSRNPDDLPAFNRKIIEEFAEGRHDRQHA